MLNWITRKLRSERGQTLIEFAFVLPIILVFLLALVDFGIALDRREVIQHAVREGARQGAVGGDAVTTTVDQSQGLFAPGDLDVCYVAGPNGEPAGAAGSFVRVSGDFTYTFSLGSGELLHAFGVSGPLSIGMSPAAQERMETSVAGATACS